LVLVFAARSCLTPVEDASLAAWSMGIGSYWLGFATAVQPSPEVMKEVNAPSDRKLVAPSSTATPKRRLGRTAARNRRL
jgi:hypothetical protein